MSKDKNKGYSCCTKLGSDVSKDDYSSAVIEWLGRMYYKETPTPAFSCIDSDSTKIKGEMYRDWLVLLIDNYVQQMLLLLCAGSRSTAASLGQ
jgi:hypothetical protein